MKSLKVLLFCLMLMLLSWCRCSEIHDAAPKGDMAKVKPFVAEAPAALWLTAPLATGPQREAAETEREKRRPG